MAKYVFLGPGVAWQHKEGAEEVKVGQAVTLTNAEVEAAVRAGISLTTDSEEAVAEAKQEAVEPAEMPVGTSASAKRGTKPADN